MERGFEIEQTNLFFSIKLDAPSPCVVIYYRKDI
jgi:hypothetical protein